MTPFSLKTGPQLVGDLGLGEVDHRNVPAAEERLGKPAGDEKEQLKAARSPSNEKLLKPGRIFNQEITLT